MSTMDGLTHVSELMQRAAGFGHQVVAITDHGSIQAFPQADQAGKKLGIKVIYGVEAYLVDQFKQDRPFHVILLAASKGLSKVCIADSNSSLIFTVPRIPVRTGGIK